MLPHENVKMQFFTKNTNIYIYYRGVFKLIKYSLNISSSIRTY
jgi:hypothetical protein